jgi:hypothetical protein
LPLESARVSSARPSVALSSTFATPERAAAAQARLERRLADCVSATDEALALLEISIEIGAREVMDTIGERLSAVMDSVAFEDELRRGPDMAGLRLRRLTGFRVRVNASPLCQNHQAHACAALRRIEALIHADAARAADVSLKTASGPG